LPLERLLKGQLYFMYVSKAICVSTSADTPGNDERIRALRAPINLQIVAFNEP
jgi:hypothetical protein